MAINDPQFEETLAQVAASKIENGLEELLKPMELEALEKVTIRREKERAERIVADFEAGKPVSPEDQAFLQNVVSRETTRQEQIVDPRTGVPSVVNVSEKTLEVLQGAGLDAKKRKDIANKIAAIAPIAELEIEPGKTVLAKLLIKELGAKNVISDQTGKNFMIRTPSGFTRVPTANILPDLARAGVQIGLGAGLEYAGAAFAPETGGLSLALPAIGAAIGTGGGEALIFSDAVNRAKDIGIISGDEASILDEMKGRVLAAGGFGAIFGAGGKLPAVIKAAKAARKTGKSLGEAVETGLRQEGSLATKAGQAIERVGFESPELTVSTAAAKGEAGARQLVEEFAEVEAADAGRILQEAIESKRAALRQARDEAFELADAQFAEQLERGTFGFADVSGALSSLEKELAREGAGNPEFARLQNDILPQIRSSLNATKAGIREGVLPANRAVTARFFKPMAETGVPTNPGFDPKQVTAADLRQTFNSLRDTITDLNEGGAPQRLMAKKLIQLKNSIGASLGDPSIAISGKTTPYISGIKPGAAAKDFKLYKDAFSKSAALKQGISPKLERLAEGATDISRVDPEQLTTKLSSASTSKEIAEEALALIDEYDKVNPGARQNFTKSYQKSLLTVDNEASERSAEQLAQAAKTPSGAAAREAAIASGQPLGTVEGTLPVTQQDFFAEPLANVKSGLSKFKSPGVRILARSTEETQGMPIFEFRLRDTLGQQQGGKRNIKLLDKAAAVGAGGATGFGLGMGSSLIEGEDLEKGLQKGITFGTVGALGVPGVMEVAPKVLRGVARPGGRLLANISPLVTPTATIASQLLRSPEPGAVEGVPDVEAASPLTPDQTARSFPEGLLRTDINQFDEKVKRILGIR